MTTTDHRLAKPVAAVALLMLLVGVVALASGASTHHATLTVGDPQCVVVDGQAHWQISYTTSSWNPGASDGRHDDIEIWWGAVRIGQTQSTTSWLNQATRAVDGLTFTESTTSRSGTFLVPANMSGTTIWVGSYARGPWADGSGGNELWGTGDTGIDRNHGVTLPNETCALPAAPGATAEVVCVEGVVRFRLTNTGGSAIALDILVDGVNRANNVNVPAGATADAPVVVDFTFATLGLAENQTLPFVVERQDGTDVATGTLLRDCDLPAEPGASAERICASGGGGTLRVTLTNDGGEPVTFDVDGTPHPVGPGGEEVVDVPAAEDETVTVVVTAPGMATRTFTETFDCVTPEPAAGIVACVAGGVRVDLANTGTQSVPLVVRSGGIEVETVVLDPDGTDSVTVPVAEGAAYAITVEVQGGAVVGSWSGTRDCTDPHFGAVVCATSGVATGVSVTLTNDGELDAVVTLSAPPPAGGIAPNPVTVPAGGSAAAFVAQAEGAVGFTLTGTSAGNTAITVAVPLRDCQVPVPTVGLDDDCAVDGVVVVLGNEQGQDDAVFTVTDGGDPVGGPVTVPPGQSVAFTVPVAEGATYAIDASVAGGYPVTGGPVAGTRDCQVPVLVAVQGCAAGGVLVRIGNDGELPVTVTVPGAVVPTRTVDPGSPVEFLIPQEEGDPGAAVTVATGVGNEPLTVTYGARDCVAAEVPVITHECGDDVVLFTLGNTDGALPATFTVVVTDDGGTEVPVDGVDGDGEVTVAAGQTVQLAFPVTENHTYTVSVSEEADGDLPDQVIVVDCHEAPNPQASAERICATDGSGGTLQVSIGNGNGEGGEGVTFTVDGPDGEETHALEGGEALVLAVAAGEDETVTVTVTAPDLLLTFTETFDCAEPEVEVALVLACAADGVRITLTNDGLDSGTYVVANGGVPVPGLSGVIPATDVVDLVVPVAEGQAYSVTVTVDGEPVGDPLTGTRNCEVAFTQVEVAGTCTAATPGFRWSVEVDSPWPASGLTVELLDADGQVVERRTGLGRTGELPWPGTVVDEDGVAIDWPGWVLRDDTWVRADDGFLWARPTLDLRFLVNPTSPVSTLAYPEPSPTCNAGPPAGALGDQASLTPGGAGTGGTPLPRTGGGAVSILPLALALGLAGIGLTILSTERRRTARAARTTSR